MKSTHFIGVEAILIWELGFTGYPSDSVEIGVFPSWAIDKAESLRKQTTAKCRFPKRHESCDEAEHAELCL